MTKTRDTSDKLKPKRIYRPWTFKDIYRKSLSDIFYLYTYNQADPLSYRIKLTDFEFTTLPKYQVSKRKSSHLIADGVVKMWGRCQINDRYEWVVVHYRGSASGGYEDMQPSEKIKKAREKKRLVHNRKVRKYLRKYRIKQKIKEQQIHRQERIDRRSGRRSKKHT